MSASILRNLVASVFNVKATSVVLSGEISPHWKGHYTSGVSYMDYTIDGIVKIWGFDPKKGFKEIEGVIKHTQMFNGNHDSHFFDAEALHTKVSGSEVFFVTEHFTDTIGSEGSSYTLYKAPDFKSHWAAIKATDVARWEEWLNA